MARPTLNLILNLADRETKRKLIAQIGALSGLYQVQVKPRRDTRTNQQNRYYYGVVVQAFREFLAGQGETLSTDLCHTMLKSKFLKLEIVNRDTGEPIGETLRSTAELNIGEMADYIDRCIHWLDEMFGIVVPAPDYSQNAPTPSTQEMEDAQCSF